MTDRIVLQNFNQATWARDYLKENGAIGSKTTWCARVVRALSHLPLIGGLFPKSNPTTGLTEIKRCMTQLLTDGATKQDEDLMNAAKKAKELGTHIANKKADTSVATLVQEIQDLVKETTCPSTDTQEIEAKAKEAEEAAAKAEAEKKAQEAADAKLAEEQAAQEAAQKEEAARQAAAAETQGELALAIVESTSSSSLPESKTPAEKPVEAADTKQKKKSYAQAAATTSKKTPADGNRPRPHNSSSQRHPTKRK